MNESDSSSERYFDCNSNSMPSDDEELTNNIEQQQITTTALATTNGNSVSKSSTDPLPAAEPKRRSVNDADNDESKHCDYEGTGFDVSWDRNKHNRQSVFLTDIIAPPSLKDDEDNNNEGQREEVNPSAKDSSMRASSSIVNSVNGNGIKDKNVFVLEVASDTYTSISITLIYITFTIMAIFENTYLAAKTTNVFPAAVFPDNATTTGNSSLCYPQSDGLCTPSTLDVDQATLLANTVVVSDGINVTDWDGSGAKPGSPSFTAHNISSEAFIADKSVLDYSANSDLQSFWDEIIGVVWTGHSFGGSFVNYRSFTISLQLEKIYGDWPSNMTDAAFPIYVESYSCVKGGSEFCESVGNWRLTMKYDTNPDPEQKLEGNVFSSKMIFYNYYVDGTIMDRDGWRFVLRADPGDVLSDCIRGNNCKTSLVLEGGEPVEGTKAWSFLAITITYLGIYIWWIFLLFKRRGGPKTWPRENDWLIAMGVGFILQLNPFQTGLTLSREYDPWFSFSRVTWAVAAIITRLGHLTVGFGGCCFLDNPRKYVASNFDFYKYKVLYFLIYFTSVIITVLLYFCLLPGTNEPGTDSQLGGVGYGTSVVSWSKTSQDIALSSVIATMTFTFGAYVYYAWKSYVGFRLLDTLPYGMTRHTQLSFRFFFWASGLWFIVNLTLTIHRFVTTTSETNAIYYTNGPHVTLLALNRTVIVGDYRNIPNIVYLFVMMVVNHYFFLPPLQKMITSRSITYHVSNEDELRCTTSRQSRKKHVMVLEKALLLCICSKEVYRPFDNEELLQRMNITKKQKEEQNTAEDTPQSLSLAEEGHLSNKSMSTVQSAGVCAEKSAFVLNPAVSLTVNEPCSAEESVQDRIAGEMVNVSENSDEPAPINSWAVGCRVVSRIYERGNIDIHDTRVIIFRHESSNDLIVAFRGTATVKQAKTDLMMSKVSVCLDTFLMMPSRTEKWMLKTKYKTNETASGVEDKLITGEVNKVRLLDIIPKTTEKLPSYLRDARKAKDYIPGKGKIHFGFWSSYNRVRRELHCKIREELITKPGKLIITGHSLGGAQATLCAYDMCRWVMPTVKHQIQHELGGSEECLKKIQISCYTFGSPKCGSLLFAKAFNKVVLDSQRIVCDGDFITSGPLGIMNYHHVKRENIFDFTGTVRVEPGLMEKKFALKTRNKTSSHKMENYLKVIQKSFDPVMSEEMLLDRIREAYGYKRKDDENQAKTCSNYEFLPCNLRGFFRKRSGSSSSSSTS